MAAAEVFIGVLAALFVANFQHHGAPWLVFAAVVPSSDQEHIVVEDTHFGLQQVNPHASGGPFPIVATEPSQLLTST